MCVLKSTLKFIFYIIFGMIIFGSICLGLSYICSIGYALYVVLGMLLATIVGVSYALAVFDCKQELK